MISKYFVLSLFLLLATLNGCYFDNAESLYPEFPTVCDDTQADYQSNVKPIIQLTCYNCHNNSNASALGSGINLESTSTLSQYVSNGSFLGSIEHRSGYSAMPKGGAKLTNCQIETIKSWINNGAPTN